MWDPEPYIDALVATVHPSVQAENEALRHYLLHTVLGHGERRPDHAAEVMREMPKRPVGFVYDRASGLIFAGGWADHERCAGCLMLTRELRGPVDWGKASYAGCMHNGKAVDRFLEDGHGFVANSPSLTSGVWPLSIGSEVTLTSQEKTWFKGMELRRR